MAEVNQTESKSPIMPILKKLEIGESYSYPCARMNVVKSVVCQVQVTTGKVFRTRLEKPRLVVTRIK